MFGIAKVNNIAANRVAAAPALAGGRATAATMTASPTGFTFPATGKFGGNSLSTGSSTSKTYTITVDPTDTSWYFNSNKTWTIEFWVNVQTLGSEGIRTIFNLGSTLSTGGLNITDPVANGTWQLNFNNGGTYLSDAFPSPGSTAANTWYHIAIQSTGTNIQYWVNGVLKYNAAQSITGTNRSFSIGHSGGINASTVYFDSVRVSNQAVYNYTFVPVTAAFQNSPSTLALFNMDGVSTDNTTAARTATPVTRTGNTITSTAQFQFGTASGYSDGVGDYLIAPAMNLHGNWTMEGWFRPDSPYNTTGDRLFFNMDNTVYMMVTQATNTLLIYIGGSAIGSVNITAGAWHHIVFMASGSSIYGYVDGVYQTARGWGGYSTSDVIIAGGASTNYKGFFDEIRISNTARYPVGTNFTPPTAAFTNDSNTLLLLHLNGALNGTVFTDDNA